MTSTYITAGRKKQKRAKDAKEVSDLEFAQLQLHHVLTGGLNKDGREQLGVGLHLK